jgi:hypothetical protein
LIKQEILLGRLFFYRPSNYVLKAIPQSGVFSDGFQTQTPAIQAKAVFQAQTATGKLNAEIIPTTPNG